MENIGENCYSIGVQLFENGDYERAVQYFIQSYNLGYEKKQILENLYACFVLPNEQEFRDNYNKNREGITQIPFEESVLDFIPVTEKRFYIYDKEQEKFAGVFELEDEPIQGEQEEFDSILFADIWDVREMLSTMREKKWNLIYIVLNEQERKFVSFLKLPQFKELYLKNVAVFQDTNLMCTVFEQYDAFYLPKNIVAKDGGKYLKLIDELHVKRLHHRERDNVFLSICIPSYNRGSVALRNVSHLLHCPYDSEIEIIVSNNGSTKDEAGYQEIKNIRDVRIVYHEFEKNQGFASNILKTLELAKGKFAVLVSDEDLMILEHMNEYLTCLKKNSSCGVFLEGGIGASFRDLPADKIYHAGADAFSVLVDLNYVTGMTFHVGILKKSHAFEIITRMRGNGFLEYYTHITLALIVGKYANFYRMKLILWDARNAVEVGNIIPRYMLPETRIFQQNSIMEFYQKGLLLPASQFVSVFLNRAQKTYYLLELSYCHEKFRELYVWEEVCFFVYREQKKYLEEFPVILTAKGKDAMQKALRDMFLFYLNSEKIFSIRPLEEQAKKKMAYQTIQKGLEEGKSIEEVEEEAKAKYHLHYIGGNKAKIDIIDTFVSRNDR